MKTCLTSPRRGLRGFTLTELLVVIGIIALLAALLTPALAGAKRKANQIKCLNNIRQVNLALTLYAGDHRGEFPPRREPPEAWPWKLLAYYQDPAVLVCPSDSLPPGFLFGNNLTNRLMARRSYVINGFNDYFRSTLSPEDYRKFDRWLWPSGMKESAIPFPSETITFGEKKQGSFHVHMDFSQGTAGNDVEEIEQNRHRAGGQNGRDGGSNFAFADGSVRLLKHGQSVKPQNLWAVREEWRNAPVRLP